MGSPIIKGSDANTVLVTTDCVSDLTVELREKYRIPIMHYYVQTQEARFQDTAEITSDNLIEYIEVEKKKAYSGCASAEEYRVFFEKQRAGTDRKIIHICMARHASDAYEVASAAASQMEGVYVVDSGHLSGGMGLMVVIAADMAQRGAPCEVILEETERLRGKISSSFIVNSTECLYRNGKIAKSVYSLCERFSLHPIIQLKKSQMRVTGICLGKPERFARKYLRKMLRNRKEIVRDMAFLITAGCPFEFQQFLRKEVEKRVSFQKVYVNIASATISCNCGSGAFGVLFLRK